MEKEELKIKNVSKVFFTLVCLLCCSYHIHAQQLLGTYYVEYRFNDFSTKYTFNEDGIFSTEHSGDLGLESYGKGHYFIKKDSLILDYNLTQLKENSYHKVKHYSNSKDSIQLKIYVSTFREKPLNNISIIGDIKRQYGVLTNKNGIAYLKFKKRNKQIKIRVSDLCCGHYNFHINTKQNYEINVFLKGWFNNPISIKDEIVYYKILELTKDYIKLKNKNGNLLIWKKKN